MDGPRNLGPGCSNFRHSACGRAIHLFVCSLASPTQRSSKEPVTRGPQKNSVYSVVVSCALLATSSKTRAWTAWSEKPPLFCLLIRAATRPSMTAWPHDVLLIQHAFLALRRILGHTMRRAAVRTSTICEGPRGAETCGDWLHQSLQIQVAAERLGSGMQEP